MRNFIISLCCLSIIVVMWSVFYISASSRIEDFNESIDTITVEYVNNEEWDKARTAFDETYKSWNRFKKSAAFFLNSESINHIDNTFRKTHFYISADDKSNSSGELAYLKGLFSAMIKNESLSMENVF